MKIGIVEDQVLYQRYLRELITRELGYEVVMCTADGEDALNLCSASGVELLILDLRIQKMHGIELAEKLLRENPLLKFWLIPSR